jgi:hypothetical protein
LKCLHFQLYKLFILSTVSDAQGIYCLSYLQFHIQKVIYRLSCLQFQIHKVYIVCRVHSFRYTGYISSVVSTVSDTQGIYRLSCLQFQIHKEYIVCRVYNFRYTRYILPVVSNVPGLQRIQLDIMFQTVVLHMKLYETGRKHKYHYEKHTRLHSC